MKYLMLISCLLLLPALAFGEDNVEATVVNGKKVMLGKDGTWKNGISEALTADGKKVLLKPDGTWKFLTAVPPNSTELVLKGAGEDVMVGLQYTSNNFNEFLWGLTRPLHVWNTSSAGKTEVLPFWTRPFKEGGLLSWLNPGAWKRNPSLTAGTLASELALALAASGGGGGGDASETGTIDQDTGGGDDDGGGGGGGSSGGGGGGGGGGGDEGGGDDGGDDESPF